MQKPELNYYCGSDRCRWMTAIEQQAFYPDWVDTTNMSEDEFLAFITKEEGIEA